MPMSTPANLYNPTGIIPAHEAWGANCGPCALAALTGKRLQDVRKHLAGFETRRYMNPTHMIAAVKSLKLRSRKTPPGSGRHASWPQRGLVFIQLCGAWDGAGIAAQYCHTHWVATLLNRGGDPGRFVYDVNAGEWWSFDRWIDDVLVAIARDQKATGWYARNAMEVFK